MAFTTYNPSFPGLDRVRSPVGKTFIYVLLDPKDSTVRYVGQTSNPELRQMNHAGLTEFGITGNRGLVEWKKRLRGLRFAPILFVVDAAEGAANGLEKQWISYYRGLGDLLNVDAGGSAWKKRKKSRDAQSLSMDPEKFRALQAAQKRKYRARKAKAV